MNKIEVKDVDFFTASFSLKILVCISANKVVAFIGL